MDIIFRVPLFRDPVLLETAETKKSLGGPHVGFYLTLKGSSCFFVLTAQLISRWWHLRQMASELGMSSVQIPTQCRVCRELRGKKLVPAISA